MPVMSRRALLRTFLPAGRSEPAPEPGFVIHVARERCITFRGPECGACAGLCPDGAQALVLRRSRPEFTAVSCQGCGRCVSACPMIPAALEIRRHVPDPMSG
jgi:MinD superfamily P-loop ATPase